MNCCNEYGECKQGHGCPVRSTSTPKEEPENIFGDMVKDMAYGVGLWFLVSAVVTLLWMVVCKMIG